MKHIININLSKDTPAETLTALYTALKVENKKFKDKQPLYALNEDIEKLHERYEQLFKQVKTSLNLSERQIEKECETLSQKYDFELKELSKLRKVDYDIKIAEIKARENERKPWRRCWLWRLLFRPLTNRAQDIIEEREELNADIIHSSAEKEIEAERNKQPETVKTPSKRKLRREMRKELKKIIERADNANPNEMFTEPQDVPKSENAEPAQELPKTQDKQLPGQMTLDDVQPLAQPTRRPRPPRSCRK